MMKNREIPQGIKVIGWFYLLSGIMGLVLSPLIFFATGLARPSGGGYLFLPVVPITIFLIFLGHNLINKKSWTRNTALTLSLLYFILHLLLLTHIVFGLNVFVFLNPLYIIILVLSNIIIKNTFSYNNLFINMLLIIIYGFIIIYFIFNKKVKEYFGQ